MDFTDFLTKALEPAAGQRRGQWFANLTHTLKPALLNRMIHLDVDPFYDDAKLWAAVEFVKEHWNDEAVQSPSTEDRM